MADSSDGADRICSFDYFPIIYCVKTVELSDGDHHFPVLPDLYLESDESK
jgi:hypothetical protein